MIPHIMITQDMVSRAVKLIPNIQERLVVIMWEGEISQLNDKVRFALLHVFHKKTKPGYTVVDHILVHIGHHAYTDGFYWHLFKC